MNVGLAASNAAKAFLSGLSLITVTKFYAEIEDPSNADDTEAKKRELPCVICYMGSAQEYPPFTGNYSGDLFIRVEGAADDLTAAQFTALFEEVWENISTNTILSDLTAAQADFTAIGFTGGIQQTAQIIEGRIRTKSMILPINCCAKDVS